MTYYERLRHEPRTYDSPEDRMDRFMRIQRKTEFDIEKEMYELEQTKRRGGKQWINTHLKTS